MTDVRRAALALLAACFIACSTLLAARDVGAQGVRSPGGYPTSPGPRPSLTSGYKDPRVARRLGIVFPGLGHAYAEEWGRGFGAFDLTLIGLAGGAFFFALAPSEPNPASTRTLGAGFAVVGVGTWVWSAIDAPSAAQRTNAKRILRHDASLSPFVGGASNGSLLAGLSVPLR